MFVRFEEKNRIKRIWAKIKTISIWTRKIVLISPHRTIELNVPRFGEITYKMSEFGARGLEADFVVIDEMVETGAIDATKKKIVIYGVGCGLSPTIKESITSERDEK